MGDNEGGCLCILGAGNGAHCIGGLAASKGWKVNIFTVFEKEVDNLQPAISKGIDVIYEVEDKVVKGKLNKASTKYDEVIPEADLILVCLPTFTHEKLLKEMAPHVKDGAVVMTVEGSWWGRPKEVFGGFKSNVAFGLWETLPWAVRIKEYGSSVTVLGSTRFAQMIAFDPPAVGPRVVSQLEFLIDIKFELTDSLVSAVLSCPCHNSHPCITYGKVVHWNGEPWSDADIPPFYHSMSQELADTIEGVSAEYNAVANKIREETGMKLSSVVPLYDFLTRKYADQVSDASTLRTVFSTNIGYHGVMLPVTKTDDGRNVPNFNQRYVTGDVPYGMVPIIGIAEILEVPVPTARRVVAFLQEKMGKEYVVGESQLLTGKDVGETRSPQRYGIYTKDRLYSVLQGKDN